MKIVLEVETLSHTFVRKGGKDNRRQQRARMVRFAEFVASLGAGSLAQVGQRHVIAYWKVHRSLAPVTAYAHWLAIRELWRLAGKSGDPPKPCVPQVQFDLIV